MSEPTEDSVEAIKGMEITHDEEQIREALRRCNNNPQEAVQLLLPESPPDSNLLSSYTNISSPSQSNYGRTDSYDADVDMRDTETHPGSGGESDRDSTTVSYSLDEDTLRDVEEEELEEYKEGVGPGGGEVELHEFPVQSEAPPPRYEDIVSENRDISPSSSPPPPPLRDMDDRHLTPTPSDQMAGVSTSIEFPLTHFYELEGRVHTDQWSIPFKRDESLAICMVAAIKMIREGEESSERGGRGVRREMGEVRNEVGERVNGEEGWADGYEFG